MAKDNTTPVLVCNGKFRLLGVPEGKFVVFGNEYNTSTLQEYQVQELLEAGYDSIEAVEPVAKGKKTED